jgi:DNA repair protein RadD
LCAFGLEYGIIAAGHPANNAPVQIASVMTLVRRLGAVGEFALVICDEAHHAIAQSWQKIFQAFADARFLGVTATPQRLDGRGLDDLFDELVMGPSVKELVDAGFLSPAVTFAPPVGPDLRGIRTRAGDFAQEALAARMSNTRLVGDAVEHYAQLCPGAPGLVYCVGIEHSQLVAQRFRAAGFRARHVDGETPKDERRAAVAALANGELDLLTNFGLFSEGVDVPVLGAVILLRPTQSLGLYLQMVGRALRPAPGKARALILDHAGNSLRHGLYDFPHMEGRENSPGAAPVRRCPECGAMVPTAAARCPESDFVFMPALSEPRIPNAMPGQLVNVAASDALIKQLKAMPYRQLLRWAGSDASRLRLAAHAKGYRRGWVYHRLEEARA